jgi:hypothetical protein
MTDCIRIWKNQGFPIRIFNVLLSADNTTKNNRDFKSILTLIVKNCVVFEVLCIKQLF